MKRRKLVLGAAAGAALLLLAGIGAAATAPDGPRARVERVARRSLAATVTGSGLVQPRDKVDISADISGRVTELAVREGQWVNRGDLVLRLDATRLQAALFRARAAVAQAQAAAEQQRANWMQAVSTLRRSEQLAGGRGWVTGAELEQARSQAAMLQAQLRSAEYAVDQAKAGLEEAQDGVDKTVIRAPMSGRVTRLNIRLGETAVVGTMNNPGSLLLTIADLRRMEARIRVEETDVPSIAVGDSAVIRIDAFPQRAFTGRVERIANSATRGSPQQSAHFQIVVALDSTPVALRPELSASADIVTDVRRGVPSIPILALVARDRLGRRLDAAGAKPDAAAAAPGAVEGVFVLRGGMARFVPVRVGIVGRRYYEVASGLRVGEPVIAGSYELLRGLEDGDDVEAVAEPAPAPRPSAGASAEVRDPAGRTAAPAGGR
ncbi:MAG: efflux transporter, family, subunit [Gemmatimonadetes bacterium]|nr:efflux transporter, family, subunit [Gemmatimonadota bacterium]